MTAFPRIPGPNPPPYRVAEVYMFDTCTHKCGYCWLAESGQVLDFAQLEPFKNPEFLQKIIRFFLSRTAPDSKWLLQLTGGEPLIAPGLEALLAPLMDAGNRIAFYTALLVGHRHPGFRFLLGHSHPQVDYIMASFHPEAELDETRYFEKIRMLKDAGHKVFLRFVGHPARLGRLPDLAERCRELEICFYPTTLMSPHFPSGYSAAQKELLRAHFSSLSQHIQLNGGLDTTGLACYGGSRVIAVNLQTGNITPCISVHGPSLGNIFEDRLDLQPGPIRCPESDSRCNCDVHFQQNVVISAEDRTSFERQLSGFASPEDFSAQMERMRRSGVHFFSGSSQGICDVADDARLFYTIDEIKENYRRRHGLFRAAVRSRELREIDGAFEPIETHGLSEVRLGPPAHITTPQGRWSYAASLPLKIPPGAAGELWVRLRVTVLQGEGGFGVLNRAGEDFQDRSFVAAGPDLRTVFLRITDASDLASVVIQNSTPDGQPAEILLADIALLAGSVAAG